jgi:hypothetical protein
MAAAAHDLELRICRQCRAMKSHEEITHGNMCRDCKCAYMRDRAAQVRAGTWAPTPGKRRQPAPREVVRVDFTPPPVPISAGTTLKAAMVAFPERYGFSALNRETGVLLGQIARERRNEIAREGWIA